jgi:ferric-dicitrate binding protein FerR (iron transport regulator)
MTEPTRYAALAARLLRERTPAKESRLSRDVGISVVAHAMELGRRRRRNARVAVATLGFGVAAAVALAVGLRQRGELACRGAACAGEAHASEAARRVLDAGQSIVAPAGAPTSVVLASGTQIALDEKSMLECRDNTATQRFALLRGGAHLHVAKLGPSERFLVDTPQAEVEVRGTVFDVKVEPATGECAPRTRVSVQEGRVEVRAEGKQVVLVGGEHWASACARLTEPSDARTAEANGATASEPAPAPHVSPASTSERHSANSPAASRGPQANARAASPNAALRPKATETPSLAFRNDDAASALAEQNDLYAPAEAARRAGQSGEALAGYTRLLARFPRGQLAESAFVARVRLLARADGASARGEAERYLTRYPAGFARAEMQTLARAP